VVGIDVEGDDAPGMDPDHLRRQMAQVVVTAYCGFGYTADLEEVGAFHRRLGDLVDDERHVRATNPGREKLR
jgi:hypothetical protein